MKTYLGIDIGGSGMKYGLGSSSSKLKYYGTVPLTNKDLASFQKMVLHILAETDKRVGLKNILGIGIGSPGLIDSSSSKVVGINPNLPFWADYDPRELIPKDYGIPVFCDNDANMMALAEARVLNLQNVMGITVGSGIGSGLIIRGKIYHGAHGFAGELGHACVVADGLACNCGKIGCVEAYSSVDGIRRRLNKENPRYSLMDLPQLLAARNSDPVIGVFISDGLQKLCMAIAGAVQCLDPEAVVIGGGGMDVGVYQLGELETGIKSLLQKVQADKMAVLQARHGNQAGVMGAIMLAEQSLSEDWERNLL